MKLKEGSFITSISLLPFILLTAILKMQNVVKGNLYTYLLVGMIIIFWISFIFSMFFALSEVRKSDNKKRMILLFTVPFIYLPIYYTKYVYKNEKVVGYGISLANVMLIVSLFFVTRVFVIDYMMELNHKNFKIKDHYTYIAKNDLFTINVDNNFVCHNNMGDYVVACDNKKDDSFLGIYSYNKKSLSDGELNDILEYHIEQTTNYVNEHGYQANVINEGSFYRVSYSNMIILVKQVIYDIKDNRYCLIIIKEVSKDNLNIFDFEKSVNNITFLV